MNELSLNRLLDLTRCISRDDLGKAERVFRIGRSAEDCLVSLEKISNDSPGFRELYRELTVKDHDLPMAILAIRSSILTRVRHTVHSPKAVCTLPDTEVTGVEDTLTETIKLINSAQKSIYVMNYWLTSGSAPVVKALVEKRKSVPNLKVILVGDSKRKFLEPLMEGWPKDVPLPAIFVYKPGITEEAADRSKMHAKTLVIDEIRMLITSANMTRAATTQNIEIGISIEAPKAVRKVAHIINELIHSTDLFERFS